MEKTVLSPEECRSRAARYCASAEHCEYEVREKLRQWGADAKSSDEIVDFLRSNRYLDDARYCSAFVHDKVAYQGWGRVKIRAMLQAKRLPSREAEDALESIDIEQYRLLAERVARKKKGATRDQMARFLLSRGFEWELISSLLPSE